MRFTVKPSQYDSVPTDLDQHGVGCGGVSSSGTTEEAADTGNRADDEATLLQADDRPNGGKPTTLEGDLEMLALKPSSVDANAVDHIDTDVMQPTSGRGAVNGGSGDEKTDRGRRSVTPPYIFPLEEQESESKTESYPAGTTSLISGESLAYRGLKYAARQRRRLVYKDGSCNISSRNVMERKRKYLVDIFTTLVDMRWRYNVLLFTAAFVLSWFAFSVVWFLIAYIHGDTEHVDDDDWKPCAAHVYDYPTALLFSMETQTTIGYG